MSQSLRVRDPQDHAHRKVVQHSDATASKSQRHYTINGEWFIANRARSLSRSLRVRDPQDQAPSGSSTTFRRNGVKVTAALHH